MDSLRIQGLSLRQFRCFDRKDIFFDQPIVLIEGDNGIGKTTILEALYYGCYLRSFRTHLPRELLQRGTDNFFIKIHLTQHLDAASFDHDIQIGFSDGKRLVKINQNPVYSYKDLLSLYRIISLTEDDIELIKGSPAIRRSFLDHAILLLDPEYIATMRSLRQVAGNRNVLLRRTHPNKEMYTILTKQLWQLSQVIYVKRSALLEEFNKDIRDLLAAFSDSVLSFEYCVRRSLGESPDHFMHQNPGLFEQEHRMGRSLFGAHLDDFKAIYQEKHSKQFASRGQQKLIVLLLRIAQFRSLRRAGAEVAFLLDDFMTDFDHTRAKALLDLLCSLQSQLIFTSPVRGGMLCDLLGQSSQLICL